MKPPTVAARVAFIAAEMVEGRWHPRRARDLAADWGISLSTVQTASAEASRVAMAALGDPSELRGRLFAALERALELAFSDDSPAHAARAVAIVAGEYARLAGVSAPAKVEVSAPDLPAHYGAIMAVKDSALFLRCLRESRAPTADELAADAAPVTH